MIKSIELLNKIKTILDKDEILENDFNNIYNLTLNKYKINGKENDIDLKELKQFKNLKTLTLINFLIDKEIIECINEMENIWAIQFSSCKFKDKIQINSRINYLVIDYCEDIKFDMINNNETIRIIGSEVNLNELKLLYNTESLYLQNCKIKNLENLLSYKKLKLLNLDGSIIEDKNILEQFDNNIKIFFKKDYNPVGGI